MTNAFIALLEKYVGAIGCAVLSIWRRVSRVILPEPDPDQPSRKIVFVKFIEQGALVLHQKTFREAAALYGAQNIYICTFASNAKLIEVMDLVPPANRIYIDESSFYQFTAGFFTALIRIRREKIDTAIDLEFFSRASAIFSYLTGAARRVGYHRYLGGQNYRGDLFTHRLHYSYYVHVADSGWSMLHSLRQPVAQLPALDIEMAGLTISPDFRSLPADEHALDLLLGPSVSGQKIVIINPSLNDTLPLRRWPEEYFQRFILGLHGRFPGALFVLTGRADEFSLTGAFASRLAGISIINLCGKTTLHQLLTLYSRAHLLLTSDSGPGHFATLTTVPAIVLFGPETPDLYGPLSPHSRVFYRSLPCSPCYNVYNNRQSTCPDNICMKHISVEEVLTAAEQIISQQS